MKNNNSFENEAYVTNIRLKQLKRNRNRKQKSAELNIILGVMIALGLLIALLSFLPEKVDAGVRYEKNYISVEVESGDTLWGFAKAYADKDYYESYDEYIQEVIELNRLQTTKIYAGKNLALPIIRIIK